MDRRTLALSFLVSLGALLVGCATPTPMAFKDDTQRLNEKSKPVYLMTAKIKNSYKTSFQPKLLVVHVEKPGAKEAADRINFTMDDKARRETGWPDEGNSYLLRMELDSGPYEIVGLTSQVFSFPIIGSFFTPVHSSLQVNGPGVYYLGRVTGTVRERQGDEFRAGPPIPLIDQAIAGASGGTFDVSVTDEWAADEALFRSTFPALKDVPVTKVILPAFDRAKAQRWWETH